MIVVENLSKKYRRNAHRPVVTTLRESFHNLLGGGFRRHGSSSKSGEFYALRDINFEVQPGEVIGIIGRNGAGKSTLLKIMSRIVFPDTGSVTLSGRVGSMLEIGAGFNQELTGRENIFLSGAILGMSTAEIRRKYNKIVEFSGVEQFIDLPVKRYSSGMYLRLAFSVAAYLEPEIIFLDEILGVGDLEFQKRCLAKIRELSALEGRAVLTVSHNLETIKDLCRRVLWLDAGHLKMDGSSEQVIAAYEKAVTESPAFYAQPESENAVGNEYVRLREVWATDKDGKTIEIVDISEEFCILIDFEVLTDDHILAPRLEFCDELGACLFWSVEVSSEWNKKQRPAGRYISKVTIPGNVLNECKLNIGVAVYSLEPWFGMNFNAPNLISLQAVEVKEKSVSRGGFPSHIPGFIRPVLEWKSERI